MEFPIPLAANEAGVADSPARVDGAAAALLLRADAGQHTLEVLLADAGDEVLWQSPPWQRRQARHAQAARERQAWFDAVARCVAERPVAQVEITEPHPLLLACALLCRRLWGSAIVFTGEQVPGVPPWPGDVPPHVLHAALGQIWSHVDAPQSRNLVAHLCAAAAALPADTEALSPALWRFAAGSLGELAELFAPPPPGCIDAKAPAAQRSPGTPRRARIAVLVQVTHHELWAEWVEPLQALRVPFDLYVVTTLAGRDAVGFAARVQADFESAQIRFTPAGGSDWQPLLQLLPELAQRDCDAVCLLQTRREPLHVAATWRALMRDAMLGCARTFASVAQAFADDSTLALAGPGVLYRAARPLLHHSAQSTAAARAALADAAHLIAQGGAAPLPEDWGCFAGNVCWLRPSAFAPAVTAWQQAIDNCPREANMPPDAIDPLDSLPGLLAAVAGQRVMLIHRHTLAPQSAALRESVLQVVDAADTSAVPGATGVESLLEQVQRAPEECALLRESGLFDADHYLSQRPGLAAHPVDPVADYLLIGRWLDLSPCPAMNPQAYRARYARQVKPGDDVLVHYLRHGARSNFSVPLGAPAPAANAGPSQASLLSLSMRQQALNLQIPWSQIEMAARSGGRSAQRVSVVVPVHGQVDLSMACLRALLEHTPAPILDVVVVDNGSDYITGQALQQLAAQHPQQIRVLREAQNHNFALGCNLGFAQTSGATVVFLGSDSAVREGWWEPLLQSLAQPEVGAVQPLLVGSDGQVRSAGWVFGHDSRLGYALYQGQPVQPFMQRARRLQALSGVCMAVRARDFAALRGFDPLFINGEEVIDLCLRMGRQMGLQAECNGQSVVLHHAAQTLWRQWFDTRNRQLLLARHGACAVDDALHYAADGVCMTNPLD